MGGITWLENTEDLHADASAGVDSSSVTPAAEPANPLAVGQVLEGKYRVARVVEEDPIAITLAATHLKLDQLVTIKVLSHQARAIPDVRARFAREAKTYARIRSEHAVQILDAGILPHIGPYMVMEYLDGSNLAELLKKEGPFSPVRATELMLQACDAVAVAHGSGVVHGDLQPSNLFVARRGNQQKLKVLGFRVAKLGEDGVGTGDGRSFEYLSPEQLREGATIDHRSDIWALGMVLYEMVTGRSGFGIDTFQEESAGRASGGPPRLRGLLLDAPVNLERVISRCIARDPAARFQNIAELAAALGPFAPGPRTALYVERCATTLRDAGFAMPVAGELKTKASAVVAVPRTEGSAETKIEIDPGLTAEAIARRARHQLPPPSLAETAIAEAMQTQPDLKVPEHIDFDLRPRRWGLKFFGGAALSFFAVVGMRWIVQSAPKRSRVDVAAPISAVPRAAEAPVAKAEPPVRGGPDAPPTMPEEHGLSTALDNEATRDPVRPAEGHPVEPATAPLANGQPRVDRRGPGAARPVAKNPLPAYARPVAVIPRLRRAPPRGGPGVVTPTLDTTTHAASPALRRAAFIQRAASPTEAHEAEVPAPDTATETSGAPPRVRHRLLDDELRQVLE